MDSVRVVCCPLVALVNLGSKASSRSHNHRGLQSPPESRGYNFIYYSIHTQGWVSDPGKLSKSQCVKLSSLTYPTFSKATGGG